MDMKTLLYYEKNKELFKNSTQNLSFAKIQDLFLSYLKPNSLILDFGCGAGRDIKYFLDKNFQVDAIDGSISMCKIASEYCNIVVKKVLFEDFNTKNKYDGIWACSSLLHIPYKELNSIFEKLYIALKANGILYVSFKLGTFEGYRNNRYFTDLTFDKLLSIDSVTKYFTLIEQKETKDIRAGRGNEKWLNIILQKR